MIKNEQHSFLAKKLHRLKEQVNYYLVSINIAKSNLTASWFNPYNDYKLKYKSDIEEYRYMLNSLSEKIRKVKKEIYIAQSNYLPERL